MAGKKDKPIDLRNIEPEDRLKYEIAGELGLLDRVLEGGWKSLTAKETGRVGGILARTDGAAVLEGDFALMGQGRLKLTYLPEGVELLAGDQVLTLSREGIYPSGLVVGHVEEIHAEASGMGQYAVVAPEADLDSLNRVFIITDFDIVE